MSAVSAHSFVYEPHPARVLFGAGMLRRLDDEAEHLGMTRALLVASPRVAREARALLGARAVLALTDAVPHVPARLAASAVDAATRVRANGLIAIGGGSAIGLAKAVARESALPILAVPTTYSGSEMTSIWGITEGGRKRTGRDLRVRPRTVLYDPELTRDLPARIAGPSGLNALAHAAGALSARDADPVTHVLATEAVRLLAEHLPRAAAAVPSDRLDAAASVLYGAWLAGVCLDRAAMGLHHKLCHVLGGSFGLPHADVHAVILPHAIALHRAVAPESTQRLAAALATEDPARAVHALAAEVHAPASLAALGMRRDDLHRAADLVADGAQGALRPVDRGAVRALLDDAFHGRLPAAS